MIYPSTATLAGDGTGTATLAPPSGFGEASCMFLAENAK